MPELPHSDSKLFEEFPPVPTEQWEEQIARDLDGEDYGRTLLWHTAEGFTLRPYYRADDLRRLLHLKADSFVEMPRSWTLRQDVLVSDVELAREHIRAALDGGAEAIGLVFRGNVDPAEAIQELLSGLPRTDFPLHIDAGVHTGQVLADLAGGADEATFAFDPLGEAAATGHISDSDLERAAAAVKDPGRGARFLCIDTGVYHDSGATVVQETALVLATLSEYLVLLIERGARAAEVLRHVFVNVSVGSSYFLEVARMRAIRLLIPQVVEAFNPDVSVDPLPLHAVTSGRNASRLEPHMNLLRATSEACAAVVGACDVLVVRPFDAWKPGGFSYRLARNVQLILRHESHLGRTGDPGAGSYYIETLTEAVAERAWQLFKELEAAGGLLKALESGLVHRMIEEKRDERRWELARGRRVLVGTNRYPVFGSFSLPEDVEREPSQADRRRRIGPPLPSFRDAEMFERIRARTENSGRQTRAVLIGDGSVSREAVAAEMLAVGGLSLSIAPVGDREKADLVVFAAPDQEYPRLLAEKPAAGVVGIVAEPSILDYLQQEPDFLLYEGCDLVETLSRIQDLLGYPD